MVKIKWIKAIRIKLTCSFQSPINIFITILSISHILDIKTCTWHFGKIKYIRKWCTLYFSINIVVYITTTKRKEVFTLYLPYISRFRVNKSNVDNQSSFISQWQWQWTLFSQCYIFKNDVTNTHICMLLNSPVGVIDYIRLISDKPVNYLA